MSKGETLWQAKTEAAAQLTTTPGAIKVIDTTNSVAIKGLLGDVFYRIYLLSGVVPSSISNVTVADGIDTTVLSYNATDENYEKDIIYTGNLPTSVSVVLTTAAGT
jgi:hypothetical protein